ncbi:MULTISPECIES: sigma-70 family RNA polymerase sigma factor [Corallincola]|uniref:RNA polymerase subunit sigma n=3 Tax=Corallincola TaxID=1775176 RepID=A0A368N4H2_9GAMM|nr:MULTISPECIES: sigma-70 family RNA polymerase sigma factor [Corallincola]RCU45116.1 RNA polymerase subunit sigma [Corallincola holothuriorum]TAA46838.1 sigma-70 family RNA polymerase sigma factor [Corallincola spongiicola]TCI04484.1 sigma-70 family RNA polymerase sigma factor [Corallincola luteus]
MSALRPSENSRYTNSTYVAKAGSGSLNKQAVEKTDWRPVLVSVATDRDKRAYASLFAYFAPRLKAFGMKQFGQEAQAMELVQETLLNVWQKAHLYHPEKGAPSTWIFTIARNLSYDMMRKKGSRGDEVCAEDLWPVLSDREPDDDRLLPEHLLMQKQIDKFYDVLSETQMEVVRKVYLEDKPQQQVAEELEIPLGTVKSRLRLAVQKLRECMTNETN